MLPPPPAPSFPHVTTDPSSFNAANAPEVEKIVLTPEDNLS